MANMIFLVISEILLQLAIVLLGQSHGDMTTVLPTNVTKDPCYQKCDYGGWGGWSICGTDGKTYGSPCYFKVSQCRYKAQNLDLQKYKDRRNKEYRKCPYWIDFGPLPPYCPNKCSRFTTTYRPVCASNGKTYPHGQCDIDYYNCMNQNNNKSTVAILREGFCDPSDACNEECSYPTDLHCGSDGRNYNNLCYLQKAQCFSQRNNETRLTLAFIGDCNRPPVDPETLDCSHVTTCPTYKRTVCGTDGITYLNSCKYFMAECTALKQGKKLDLSGYGPCKATKIIGNWLGK